jgi:hypothetical protein
MSKPGAVETSRFTRSLTRSGPHPFAPQVDASGSIGRSAAVSIGDVSFAPESTAASGGRASGNPPSFAPPAPPLAPAAPPVALPPAPDPPPAPGPVVVVLGPVVVTGPVTGPGPPLVPTPPFPAAPPVLLELLELMPVPPAPEPDVKSPPQPTKPSVNPTEMIETARIVESVEDRPAANRPATASLKANVLLCRRPRSVLSGACDEVHDEGVAAVTRGNRIALGFRHHPTGEG